MRKEIGRKKASEAMKLAIIGSRTFNDYYAAEQVFLKEFREQDITEIVSGGAKGADLIGKDIAVNFKLKYKEFLPDWQKFGRSAGFRRNQDIIDYCDLVLAFWDGKSKGTANSIDIATRQGKKVITHLFG